MVHFREVKNRIVYPWYITWLVKPMCWAVSFNISAWALGTGVDWPVIILCVIMCVVSDCISAVWPYDR